MTPNQNLAGELTDEPDPKPLFMKIYFDLYESGDFKRLKPTAVKVLLYLGKCADFCNGQCWPSYNNIMANCNLARASVAASVKQLSSIGRLEITKKKLQNGKAINIYKLVNKSGSKNRPVILAQKQGSADDDEFKKRTETGSFFELKQDANRTRTTTTAVAGKNGTEKLEEDLTEKRVEAVVAGFYRSKNINRRCKSKAKIARWAAGRLKRYTVRQILRASNECQWADDPAGIDMRLDNMPRRDDSVKGPAAHKAPGIDRRPIVRTTDLQATERGGLAAGVREKFARLGKKEEKQNRK